MSLFTSVFKDCQGPLFPALKITIVLVTCLAYVSGYSQTRSLNVRQYVEDVMYQNPTVGSSLSKPPFPNPYLSFLPTPAPASHYEAWRKYLSQRAQQTRLTSAQPVAVAALPDTIQETERNNSLASAQFVNINSRSNQNRVLIQGTLADSVDILKKFAFGQEDDGSVPLANEVPFDEPFQKITYVAAIGDGPFGTLGSGSGDFDFYEVTLSGRQMLEAKVTPLDTADDFVPVVALIDSTGEVMAISVDDPSSDADGRFTFNTFSTFDNDPYYVIVFDVNSPELTDVNDSGSGGGAGAEGLYRLELQLLPFQELEIDYFSFDLEAGDVLSASADPEAFTPTLSAFDPAGDLLINFSNNLPNIPEESPLSVDGNPAIHFVAPESGRYTVAISQGVDGYELALLALRPGLEQTPGQRQVILLDFTGVEAFNLEALSGSPSATLSSFGSFLPNWGIEDTPENRTRLVRRITEVAQENLQEDLRRSGVNSNFKVEIISDQGDPQLAQVLEDSLATQPNPVSRVIIGGSREEADINTIARAESIDPGNYVTEELAVVLLDILSAPTTPGGSANFSFSLNDVQLAPGKTIEDAIAIAVGNLIAHEAGHYLGNQHTDATNEVPTLMDVGGGGLFNIMGIGASGIFGAEDQQDVDFRTDEYDDFGGLLGRTNTLVNTAFALSFIPVGDTSLIAVHSARAGFAAVTFGARLSQSYPNPQSSSQQAQIGFTTPEQSSVSLDVYDLQGVRMANLFQGTAQAGKVHQVTLDAQQLGLKRGVYIYRLTTAEGQLEKRILVTE